MDEGLLHFTLDTYLIRVSVKQGDIKYIFLSLVWLNLELNLNLLHHWWILLIKANGPVLYNVNKTLLKNLGKRLIY